MGVHGIAPIEGDGTLGRCHGTEDPEEPTLQTMRDLWRWVEQHPETWQDFAAMGRGWGWA